MAKKVIKIIPTKVGTAYSPTYAYQLLDYIVIDSVTVYICKRVDPNTMTSVGHPLTDTDWWDKGVDLSEAIDKAQMAISKAQVLSDKVTEAEKSRESAEKMRRAAEANRVEAEKKREIDFKQSKTSADDATRKALSTYSHPPYVDADGYYYKWNVTTDSYDKTDVNLTGKAFQIKKVFASVSAMNATDVNTFAENDFILINTANVEDEDNAKLYVVATNSKGKKFYSYLVDMSGFRGFTGKTPQIVIGSVNTLAPGSSASASLVANGTDTNGNPVYTLNFAIPKGDKITLADLTEEEIKLLQKPANDAIAACNSATGNANAATSAANTAAAKANAAADDATSKSTEAGKLNSKVAADEEARVKAESGRVSAEKVRKTNEDARINAETERVTAETARADAETARVDAEELRATAENTRNDNENSRKSEESIRVSAETARNSNENTRKSQEAERVNAESGRVNAEQDRVAAEDDRVAAETQREEDFATSKKACDDATSSSKMQTAACKTATDNANIQASAAETAASAANTSKANIEKNETARQDAENTRQTQETARMNAEATRNNNETARKTAETKRQQDTSAAITNSQTQTAIAQELNEHPVKMGDNGNWWQWNIKTHAYEDTGIVARGGAMYPTFKHVGNKLYIVDDGSNVSERVVKKGNKLVFRI